MTSFEYLEMQKSLVKDINSILSKHGVKNEINLSDITITDKLVSDLVKDDKVLSNSIVESIWPSVDSLTVYHYTSKNAAESILNSGEFRLYSLLKRFDEQEIKSFCENHKLSGYLEYANGDPKYKTLIMSNMYYASFTDTNLTVDQEQYFWNIFAPIDGVRLKLKVTASNPNFRKMVYEKTKGKPLDLLSDLSQCIKSKYDKNFVLAGISRLCAFYLAKEFDIENEYRALYRAWDGFGPAPKHDGNHEYIDIPIGMMSDTGYQIDIEEIQSNENLAIPSQYSVVPRNT
ncbi:hypothetical protein [Yokenella regensburgei]|uniref:hypothetical protein n=1 Tax=Yokenella regensburgei TaxID=158877 RepID=UPI001432DA48|nr:hypothetical protein [Yokenella regensburgei]QIU89495.1 hypothetical protein HEC60_09345 [Yokenella regensburgei]